MTPHDDPGPDGDVVRIRLQRCAKSTVMVSEFRSADRVLADWARESGCDCIDFEVKFFDGCILRGCYAIAPKAKSRQAFSKHIRHLHDASRTPAPSFLDR